MFDYNAKCVFLTTFLNFYHSCVIKIDYWTHLLIRINLSKLQITIIAVSPIYRQVSVHFFIQK